MFLSRAEIPGWSENSFYYGNSLSETDDVIKNMHVRTCRFLYFTIWEYRIWLQYVVKRNSSGEILVAKFDIFLSNLYVSEL